MKYISKVLKPHSRINDLRYYKDGEINSNGTIRSKK